jgi:hypothetical protein
MLLRGINFDKDPNSAVRVLVDDMPATNIKLEKLEADGSFYLEFLAGISAGISYDHGGTIYS